MNGIPTDWKLTPTEVKEFSDVFQKTLLEISILDSLYGDCNDISDYVKSVLRTSVEDLNNFGTLKTLQATAAVVDYNTEHLQEDEQKEGDLWIVQSQNDGREPAWKFSNDEQFLQQYESLKTNLQSLQHDEEEIDSIIEKCTVSSSI